MGADVAVTGLSVSASSSAHHHIMVIVSNSMGSNEVPAGLEFLLQGPDPKYRFEENAIPTRDPESWAKLDVISPETKQFTRGLASELHAENSSQWDKLHSEAVENRHQDETLATQEQDSLYTTELLYKAAYDCDQATSLRCLESGVDPNDLPLLASSSALSQSVSRGCLPIAAMLLQHKANVNQADHHGTTALHVACDRGPIEIVELLLHARASINKADSWGQPWPLQKAAVAGHGDVDIVRVLLESKANPNKRNLRGHTACDAAAELGDSHAPIVAILQASMDNTDGDSDDYSEPELQDMPDYEAMYTHPGWVTCPDGSMQEKSPEWFQGQPQGESNDESWFRGQAPEQTTR